MRRPITIGLVVAAALVGLAVGMVGPARGLWLRPLPPAHTQTQSAAIGPRNVYAAAMALAIPRQVAGIGARVYVPNSGDATVDVIDPTTRRVIAHFAVGAIPHHIAPSWDLTHLYVDNTAADTLTVIDPRRGEPVATLKVADPYNLYFTPDGRYAVVVAERLNRLDFYDPSTWVKTFSVPIPWAGVDHLDFSADGTYLLASTEFSGIVAKVDIAQKQVTGTVEVGSLPVDVRLAPEGTVFFVANQGRHGVSVIDPERMQEIAFIPTGKGAHGLQISRDTRSAYVSNRLAGTISVIDLATRQVTATWSIGGSPDMMQVSPDGSELWTSNRFGNTVSVIDTATGTLLARVDVGRNPHGLTYFPQPGRFSLGHNGVYR